MARHTKSGWRGTERTLCRVCPDLFDPFAPVPEGRFEVIRRGRGARTRRTLTRNSSTRAA